MAMRGPRHPIGAAPWITEERTTALQISKSEAEEFMFSAKNEMDWLNEHMAEIFSENQMCVSAAAPRERQPWPLLYPGRVDKHATNAYLL